MAIMTLEGLTKELRSGDKTIRVLDSIDLSIDEGEFLAVLGPSGSGKSTLLGLMAGLDRPTSGTITFRDRDLGSMSEDDLARLRRDQIGFVFQSFQLLGHMTAAENVLVPLELRRAPDRRKQVRDLLEAVGLGERGHHYPSQLSGGEQQRVALARAFAAGPSLLLADEPTGNLDSKTGDTVLDLLADLQRSRGVTLVLVTHDPAIARHADRAIYLRDGRIEREERVAATSATTSA
jgi:putative ABC transport system ATP-binding protein